MATTELQVHPGLHSHQYVLDSIHLSPLQGDDYHLWSFLLLLPLRVRSCRLRTRTCIRLKEKLNDKDVEKVWCVAVDESQFYSVKVTQG